MENVKICIGGRQKAVDGKTDKVSMLASGQYYFRNNKHYIKYDDSSVDADSVIKTTLKISDDELVIIRRGVVDSQQIFRNGEATQAAYRTPYGVMDLYMDTRRLAMQVNLPVIVVDLEYTMSVDGSIVGDYTLHIEIAPDKNV